MHSRRMQPSLDDTRQRLTPQVRPGGVRFSSIRLEQPTSRQEAPRLPEKGSVTFRLGVFPGPPEKVLGYLYQEESGRLLADLPARVAKTESDELVCSFTLPRHLLSSRVCVVIEGRWSNGVAGCEMSFRAGG